MPVDFDRLVLGPAMKAFGEPITYTPKAAAAFALPSGGVFTAEHEAVSTEGDLEVSSTAPVLGVRLSDFPPGQPPGQGDWYSRNDFGENYTVLDRQPDGHGGLLLISQKR